MPLKVIFEVLVQLVRENAASPDGCNAGRSWDRSRMPHSDGPAVPTGCVVAHSRGPNDCASLVKEVCRRDPSGSRGRPAIGLSPRAKVSVGGPLPQSTRRKSSFSLRTRFLSPSTIYPQTVYRWPCLGSRGSPPKRGAVAAFIAVRHAPGPPPIPPWAGRQPPVPRLEEPGRPRA